MKGEAGSCVRRREDGEGRQDAVRHTSLDEALLPWESCSHFPLLSDWRKKVTSTYHTTRHSLKDPPLMTLVTSSGHILIFITMHPHRRFFST